uniref:YCII-related domain-containing protein n=1 Tax=uncultured Actinomycetes bacterium TaxID=152507 RepID=A0A871XY98_9ACTN|nr:hypothetical protein HULAa55C9_00004 [uncultured Actinomycetes bacterium]QOV09085.1 hypothetical protein HULAa32G3_00005 [uncultured Actinomycetes bacterium]
MRFLIAVIDSDTGTASPGEMAAIDAFNDSLRAGDHWVLATGLHHPREAKVIDNTHNAGLQHDGPLNDTAEYMSGFWIIECDSHERALELAHQGSLACNRKVEVRAFH